MTTDKAVRQLFDKVQKKKLEVEKAQKPSWETSGLFGYSADSAHDRVNIQITTDVRKIVQMYAFLIDRAEKFVQSAKELEVDTKFTWLGFYKEEWFKDFKTRINILQIQAKRKELNDLEVRLNAIISPELKAQLELEAVGKVLQNL